MLNEIDHKNVDELWNKFKTDLQYSVTKNKPTKTIRKNNCLPWVSNALRKKMNSYKRKLNKRDKTQVKNTQPSQKIKG